MKRQYIVAVLALLGLGLVSTLALGTFTNDLTETLTTETTLDYVAASVVLDEANTEFVSTDSFTVTFDVTQSTAEEISLTVSAHDAVGDVLPAVGTASYSYVITYDDSTTVGESVVSITGGEDLEFTITTSSPPGVITSIEITFVSDGLFALYYEMNVSVTDI